LPTTKLAMHAARSACWRGLISNTIGEFTGRPQSMPGLSIAMGSAMSSSESSSSPRRNRGIVLCLIVVAAVALRAYWPAGLLPKDDAEYARVA